MKIISHDNDIRIDKYLAGTNDLSRETITKMIKEGFILVNGKVPKGSYKVQENDEIEIMDGFIKETNVEPVEMDIPIVYEDNDVMVIDKPSGLVVHPGNGNYNNTLVNGLMYYTNNLSDIGDETRPGIVHRLDKDTSGLMLVAKSNKAHEVLADDFKNKRVLREYIALLDGVFPQNSATIDAPIGRDKNNFQKMAVMASGKHAVTHLSVIKKYADYTLVKLQLETGRTHQIRVHLAYVGYPVHNDPVYGKKSATYFGQFLHSHYVKFVHPITKEVMEFSSPLPPEFQSFLDNLDESN